MNTTPSANASSLAAAASLPAWQISIGPGAQFARAAKQLWRDMNPIERQQMCWDAPQPQRLQIFNRCLARSPLAVVGLAGCPFVIGWLLPLYPTARTAAIHFAAAGARPEALTQVGQLFMAACAQSFSSLITTIPMPFRGARAIAKALGFVQLATLPAACFIATHNRCVNGALLVRNLETLRQ